MGNSKKDIERRIKDIEAKHSPALLHIMEEAFKEYLMDSYGIIDQDKLDTMLNLNASRLYSAISEPLYSDAGIIRK